MGFRPRVYAHGHATRSSHTSDVRRADRRLSFTAITNLIIIIPRRRTGQIRDGRTPRRHAYLLIATRRHAMLGLILRLPPPQN